ncbi:MAG: HD domain-containing protein [Lachnospiraceae bacterium]|nr:HD domain-containing protein [Eubacterium sp.]MBQ3932722.1 HD domain-containing protein [Lachnospiraceae bacterium]
MIYTELTKKAINIAYKAHDGQLDRSGIPYIFHPMHIADQMTTEETCIVAILHDVVEDTDVTLEELKEAGFGEDIIHAIDLLTHRDGVPYLDYVRALKDDPIASVVKLADLNHNSDRSRLSVITKKDEQRFLKYQKAKEILQGIQK